MYGLNHDRQHLFIDMGVSMSVELLVAVALSKSGHSMQHMISHLQRCVFQDLHCRSEDLYQRLRLVDIYHLISGEASHWH